MYNDNNGCINFKFLREQEREMKKNIWNLCVLIIKKKNRMKIYEWRREIEKLVIGILSVGAISG